MTSRQNSYSMQPKVDQSVRPTHLAANPPKKTAFVHKLYAMLSDPNLSHLIWWSRKEDDCVFALHPGTEFANVLTNYFKHGNVSSFVRQLHMYGFHKVFDTSIDFSVGNERNDSNAKPSHSDDLIWEFRHSTGNFKKGDEASLVLIKRRSSNKVINEGDLRSASPGPIPPGVQFYYPVHHYQIHPPDPHQFKQQVHPEHYMVQQQAQQRFFDPRLPPEHQDAIAYQMQHQLGSPYTPTQPHFEQPQHAPSQNQPTQYPEYQSQPSQEPLRNMSTTVPTEKKAEDLIPAHQVASDLNNQQRLIAAKSDYLNSELRSTVSDVLKFSDTIPKFAPALRNTTGSSQEDFNAIQHSFYVRADQYKPSRFLENQPQPHLSHALPPKHELNPNTQQTQGSHSHHQQAPLVNPFVPAVQHPVDNVHFWEGSNARQPSVFVDPLHSSPDNPSRSSSSSQRSLTRDSLVPASNNTHLSPSGTRTSPKPSINSTTSSLAHIHFRQSLAQQVYEKRNDSLPTSISRQNPPRSIPDDYSNKSSIPNISHLTSQLRPSVLEVHSHKQGSFTANSNTSISSQSTYNSALYSGQSSISSISSRNSQASFSGFSPYGEQLQYSHPHLIQRESSTGFSTPTTASSQMSQNLHHDPSASSKTLAPTDVSERPKGGKLAVSSLLSSPARVGKSKRDDEETASPKSVKKMKSVSNMR